MWVARLDSTEPNIRADALEVITGIGKPARPLAENAVRKIAREDPFADVQMLAIEALEVMGAETQEFQTFLDTYSEASGNDDTDDERMEHLSGEDDLDYLHDLQAEGADSTPTVVGSERRERLNRNVIPADPDEQRVWSETHRMEDMETFLSQLRNPTVLADILAMGDLIERRFAALMLAEGQGENERVVEALQRAGEDSDSLVRATVETALERWRLP